MQFLIIGLDGLDAKAPARRLAVRPEHLKGLNARRAAGEILQAGAMLDEAGMPVGSAVIVEFPDRAAVDAYLKSEPYVRAGVWARTEVTPLRLLQWE